ncbi:hypothetical protein [Streptomyces sp. NPDC049040]|uniref:hypothetical protein n=1 Tax=Streptomyces sp. NPDC049040 TaxID=3365593 RepID=UPI0037192B4C
MRIRSAMAAAALAAVAVLGTATIATADAGVRQQAQCQSHDLNADVLGEVGVLNGLAGNILNGEGNPGAQATQVGSSAGCNSYAF